MKAITWNGSITTISSKRDRSLGLRIETPELSPQERSQFMEYQGVNAVFRLDPLEEKAEEVLMVKELKETKSHSQRLRNAIFRLWKLKTEAKEFDVPDNFEDYYRKVMEGFIEVTKNKMEEYE